MTDPRNPWQDEPEEVPEAEAVPEAESVDDGESSILFESAEIPDAVIPEDPFAALPDPASGASFASPWDKSIRAQPSANANAPVHIDANSDQDLLRYADEDLQVAEIVDDVEEAPIASTPPHSLHGSSAVQLGGRREVPSAEPASDMLSADDLMILDDDLPEAAVVNPVSDDSEDAPLGEAVPAADASSDSSVLDLLLGDEIETADSSSLNDPLSVPKPTRFPPKKVEADDDAFAYGEMAEALIEDGGPTTGIKVSDEIALEALDMVESPSMLNLGSLPASAVGDSHVSRMVDEDWQSNRPSSGESSASGSIVSLGAKAPRGKGPPSSAVDFSSDPDADVEMSEDHDDGRRRTSVADLELTAEDIDGDGSLDGAEDAPPPPKKNKWEQRAKEKKRTPERDEQPVAAREKKKGGGMLVGTLLGLAVGAGGVAGAYFGGFLPPPDGAPTVNSAPIVRDNRPAPVATAATVASARDLLASGDLNGALAAFDQLDASDPQVRLGRGRAKWLAYLQQQAKAQAPLDPTAELAQAAKEDFASVADGEADGEREAGAASAKLWLGLMAESLGDFKAARELYQDGEKKFSRFQRPFQAGLNRLELQAPADEKLGAMPHRDALLAFVILLQDENVVPPEAPAAAADEPGFAFWEAMVNARRHNYAVAIKKLTESRVAHDRRRLALPGNRINPESDPLEQIYLRCCDELVATWKVREGLYANPAIAAKVKDKGFDVVLKDLAGEVDEATKLRKAADDTVAKLAADLKAGGFDEPKVEESLAKALAAGKSADDKLAEVVKLVKDGGIDEPDLPKAVRLTTGAVANLNAVVAKLRDAKVVEGAVGLEQLKTGLDALIAKANTPGVGELVPPGVGILAGATGPASDALQMAARVAGAKAEIKSLQGKLAGADAAAKAELDAMAKKHDETLAAVRTPAKTLELWLAILADPGRKAEIAPATADANGVLKDARAADDVKAKATAVLALAARNSGAFAEARKGLEAAASHAGFDKEAPWAKEVAAALDDLRNPGRAAKAGANPEANPIVAIDALVKSFSAAEFPKENAQLLLKRAELKLAAGDLVGAQADAEAAVKGGAGTVGVFLQARIAEKSTDFVAAEKLFREVVKSKDATPLMIKESKIGLARSLLEQRSPSRLLGAGASLGRAELVYLLLTLLQPPADGVPPEPKPRGDQESLDLAEGLIRDGVPEGHFLKAKVLLDRERFNDAMRSFATGIAEGGEPTGEYKTLLQEIVRRNPNLRKPDAKEQADIDAAAKAARNPAFAVKAFGEGCALYYDCKFAEAEQAFFRAAGWDKEDARYLYFLGLSRWMQGNTGLAESDFRAAAELEVRGRPNSRLVNESLTRIQGDLRVVLNRFRP